MVAKLKTKSKLKIKTGSAKLATPKTLAEVVKPLVIPMGKLSVAIKHAKSEMAKLNKKFTEYSTTVSENADVFLNGDESESFDDGDFTLKISAKANSATVTDEGKDAVIMALEEIEEGLALKLAKFAIGDLRKYLTPEEFDKLTVNVEGNRRITI